MGRGRSVRQNDGYRIATLGGLVLVTVYLIAVPYAMSSTGYDTWGGVVIAPLIFIVALPVLRRMLRKVEPDPWIRGVVVFGFFAKLFFAYARFYTNEHVLGRGDAIIYHRYASDVSSEFRSFTFGGPAFENAITDYLGTEFIRLLLSIVYTVTGPTRLGGFVLFSFMSFWGLYFFYRAFSIAVVDGLRRRYAVLVFLMPSMLFWPSSVGKEAWMTTMLGLGAYGLARLIAQQRLAYLPIIAAITGLTVVRPHVAAIFLSGLLVAFVLRRTKSTGRITRKALGLLVIMIAAGILVGQLQTFFGLDDGLDAAEVFERTAERSGAGGSQFETAQPTGVNGLPWAVITVLFRPFPYEAGTLPGVVTSIEGTALLAYFMWNGRRLARLPALAVTRPYIGFVVAYGMVFVFAFSAVSNFGILARQRTQLLPVILVLLAIPIDTKLQRARLVSSSRSGPLPAIEINSMPRLEPVPGRVRQLQRHTGHTRVPQERDQLVESRFIT